MSSKQSFFPSFARKNIHNKSKIKNNLEIAKSLPLRISVQPKVHKTNQNIKKQSYIPCLLTHDQYQRVAGKQLIEEGHYVINNQHRSVQQIQSYNKYNKKMDMIRAMGLNKSLQKKRKKYQFIYLKQTQHRNLNLKMKNKLNKSKKKVHTSPSQIEIDNVYFETMKEKKEQKQKSKVSEKYTRQRYQLRGQQVTRLQFIPLSTKRQTWSKAKKDNTILSFKRQKVNNVNPETKSRLQPWLQFIDQANTPLLI